MKMISPSWCLRWPICQRNFFRLRCNIKFLVIIFHR
jgi:hypothetical protein